MPAEIVNLNRARKAKAKAEKAERADQNRILHGTPKRQRDLAKAKAETARHELDAHKKDSPGEP